MPASGPRSRGARAHPPPHQGSTALARRSATSGLRRSRRQSRHDLFWSAPTSRRLRLATQNLGGITGRGTSACSGRRGPELAARSRGRSGADAATRALASRPRRQPSGSRRRPSRPGGARTVASSSSSPSPTGVRVCLKIYFPPPPIRNVRVELGRGKIGVAEHLLNAPQVGAALE
jgi:hypothetical protein